MQIKHRYWQIWFIAILALGLIFIIFIAHNKSQTFIYTPLSKWRESGSFTLVTLQPEPAGTKLRMGPLQGAGRAELHYTETFDSGTLPAFYELYESNKPLPIGKTVRSGILPYYSITNQDVTTEYIKLTLLGNEHRIELRKNRKLPKAGIAIFEISGTHVVYHWQNAEQKQALQYLADGITLIHTDHDDSHYNTRILVRP